MSKPNEIFQLPLCSKSMESDIKVLNSTVRAIGHSQLHTPKEYGIASFDVNSLDYATLKCLLTIFMSLDLRGSTSLKAYNDP